MNIEKGTDKIEPVEIKFDNKTATHPALSLKDNNLDYFEEIAFHPSLDIKNNTLVLGFRVKLEMEKETSLFVIVTKDQIQTTHTPSFEDRGNRYVIDLNKRKLAILSRRWSRKELNEFIEKWGKNDYRKLIEPNKVFNKARSALQRHVDISDADAILMSVWAIGTYFFPIFSAFPYLHIKAPKGSGKTQALSFLQQTCFNPVKARASLPALRDTVDSLRGTYLIDQADVLCNPNMYDMKDILTDSYKRSGGDMRKMVWDKNKNCGVEEFQAYSPKAFASIKEMPEDLRDRCVVIPLLKSRKVFNPLDGDDVEWKEVRSDEYKLLMAYFPEVTLQYEERKIHHRCNNTSVTLVGRKLELWLPFEVMLSFLGVSDAEQQAAKNRFLSNYKFAEYETTELELAVVKNIIDQFNGKDEIALRPKEIATQVEDEMFDRDNFSNKQLTEKQKAAKVGRIIKKFNLSSKKFPRSNKGESYEFNRTAVENTFEAYFAGTNDDEHTPLCTTEKDPNSWADSVDDNVHDQIMVQDEHTQSDNTQPNIHSKNS